MSDAVTASDLSREVFKGQGVFQCLCSPSCCVRTGHRSGITDQQCSIADISADDTVIDRLNGHILVLAMCDQVPDQREVIEREWQCLRTVSSNISRLCIRGERQHCGLRPPH